MPLFTNEDYAVAQTPSSPAPTEAPATMLGTDGKFYTVPGASVASAVKKGWTHATPEALAREDAIKRGVAEEEQHRVVGGLKRFGNEALFGVPGMIAQHDMTPEESAIDAEVKKRFEERHPIETGAEKAAGFVAPLLIPGVGEVGDAAKAAVMGGSEVAEHVAARAGTKLAEEGMARAAETGLARKVAGSAAKVAAEGAIFSTPQAAVQLAYGDPEQAAETMLWGVGLSGVLGGGGELLGEGARAVAGKARSMLGGAAESLSKVQPNGVTAVDDIARNVLGITDADAKKLGPSRITRIVERADQEGLLEAAPKARPTQIRSMLSDSGKKIGDHYSDLEKLLDDPELAKLGPSPAQTAAKLSDEVMAKHPELTSELHAGNFKLWQKIDTEIRRAGDAPTFEGLQRAKLNIKGMLGDYNSKSAGAAIVRMADNTIKNAMEESAQKIYMEGKLPEKFADYLAQKERYEAGKALIKNVNEFKGTGRIPGGLKGFGFRDLAQVGIGTAGGPIGLGLAGLNIAREHAMKRFIANEGGLLGKSVSWLRKVAADPASAPYIGGFMAKEGQSALASHLDNLPSFLSGSKLAARGAVEAVSRFTGPTTGLSKPQQYDRVVDRLASASVNTGSTAARVGQLASAFSGTSAHLASLVAEKKLAALAYLQSQVPKDPLPARAFQREPEWKPTAAQREEFLRKVELVNNPSVVWEHYQKGTLSKGDRDTLKAVYPKIYSSMVERILLAAHDPRLPGLSHQKRVALSMFTGVPLDQSLKNLSAIQAAISGPIAQDQSQSGVAPQPSSRPKLGQHGPSLQTESQRRTFGGAVK